MSTTWLGVECPCCGHTISVEVHEDGGIEGQEGCSCWDWLDLYGDVEMYDRRLRERIGYVGEDDFRDGDHEHHWRAERALG